MELLSFAFFATETFEFRGGSRDFSKGVGR
jgi:hypothetical protein